MTPTDCGRFGPLGFWGLQEVRVRVVGSGSRADIFTHSNCLARQRI
jgi:hypothetical protein